MKNIYDVNNTPLYSFDSINSNAELFQAQYPNFNIKETLLNKQNGNGLKAFIHKIKKKHQPPSPCSYI